MGNKIMEKYFDHTDFSKQEERALKEITDKTGFQPQEEVFRGKIYDDDKVGSLIYKGTWHNKTAILKIQGLRLEIEEVDMIDRFNKQNESEIIRLPHIYDHSRWDEQTGYAYLILEYVDAPCIYQPPFATPKQTQEFCELYQEYKTRCLNRPFVDPEIEDKSSLVFTTQRVNHWKEIAKSKGDLSETEVEYTEKFLSLAGEHLPTIPMEFMHSHFTCNDIFKLHDKEYVLMSNLFWDHRPQFYDTVFHLWAGIKSLTDRNITTDQVKQYLDKWIQEYQKQPVIQKYGDFKRKFNILMAERCLGAILIDVKNQEYKKDKKKHISHLTRIFKELFDYLEIELKDQK